MKLGNNTGFTLILSVLISSIVLGIGLSIFNITFKELKLSSSGRESQFAFYAADTGIECALYHDLQNQAFSANPTYASSINCGGRTLNITIQTVGTVHTHTLDTLELGDEEYCVDLIVTKDDGPPITTHIQSRGTNICGSVFTSRRVERAIEVNY